MPQFTNVSQRNYRISTQTILVYNLDNDISKHQNRVEGNSNENTDKQVSISKTQVRNSHAHRRFQSLNRFRKI